MSNLERYVIWLTLRYTMHVTLNDECYAMQWTLSCNIHVMLYDERYILQHSTGYTLDERYVLL